LLEDTLNRLAPLTDATRTVTVIDQAHEKLAAALEARTPLGQLVRQPVDRGTGVGVLLGLTHLPANPEDVVILTPSDHGIADSRMFRRGLRRATTAIVAGRADIVLLAVVPSSPTGDLGWIVRAPGGSLVPGDLPRVGAFVEKPDLALAGRLFQAGAGWNTMVLVARVSALRDLFHRHATTQAEFFDRIRRMPPMRRRGVLEETYADLPTADFSHDVLTPAAGLHLYTWPGALEWTDLGTPERLGVWLEQHAGRPDDPRPVARAAIAF
jgi:mannose-1-phosphate guanylyltransferase